MAKKDYSDLTADEATRKMGDFLEMEMNILRDKKTGTLHTLFNVLAHRLPRNAEFRQLHDTVLEKNGIEKISNPVCYDYVPDIITAVEARGSNAAEKLKLFKEFGDAISAKSHEIRKPAVDGFLADARNFWRKIDARTQAAKLMS